VRAFLRNNSLSIVFMLLFLAALCGQAIAGHAEFNENADSEGNPHISLARYVVSSDFGSAVMENWQSEYLQFTLFILLTVWLVQRGSPESKGLDRAGRESDEDQKVGEHAHRQSPKWARVGGLRRTLYENSLVLLMGLFWLATWIAQSITGVVEYNADQLDHQQDPITWSQYLTTGAFWDNTLQNWQSEFLAVGSMAIFAVYLRQRGSPESKPVGAPHHSTGVQG
jgi:hypothetical protein